MQDMTKRRYVLSPVRFLTLIHCLAIMIKYLNAQRTQLYRARFKKWLFIHNNFFLYMCFLNFYNEHTYYFFKIREHTTYSLILKMRKSIVNNFRFLSLPRNQISLQSSDFRMSIIHFIVSFIEEHSAVNIQHLESDKFHFHYHYLSKQRGHFRKSEQ